MVVSENFIVVRETKMKFLYKQIFTYLAQYVLCSGRRAISAAHYVNWE